MTTLKYPRISTFGFSRRLLKLSKQAREQKGKKILFDLSGTEFISPFGLTMLAGTIEECIRNGNACQYRRPVKRETKAFLRGIGFHEFFKLPEDKVLKASSPLVQLKRMTALDALFVDDTLDVLEYHLNLSPGIHDSLRMSLNELLTNVFDHSQSRRGCYACVQSYPVRKWIRVAVADFGIGILRALRSTDAYQDLDDWHEAILKSVEEGVTSRASMRAGMGLHHIQRFLKLNKGELSIVSGCGKVLWKHGEDVVQKKKMAHFFDGTIIEIKVNYDRDALYLLRSELESEPDYLL